MSAYSQEEGSSAVILATYNGEGKKLFSKKIELPGNAPGNAAPQGQVNGGLAAGACRSGRALVYTAVSRLRRRRSSRGQLKTATCNEPLRPAFPCS